MAMKRQLLVAMAVVRSEIAVLVVAAVAVVRSDIVVLVVAAVAV